MASAALSSHITNAPLAYQEPSSTRNTDSSKPETSRLESHSQSITKSHFIEEGDFRPPSRRAHKHRVALVGWIISAFLGCIVLWRALPANWVTQIASCSQDVTLKESPLKHAPDAAVKVTFDQFQSMVVFGDSYSSTLFAVDGPQPSYLNSLGNSKNKRPIWVDYLTSTYNTSQLRTYDLAVSGSTVDETLVQPQFTTSTSFKQQVGQSFTPAYGVESSGLRTSFSSQDTLFAIWFGVEDIMVSGTQVQSTPIDLMMDSYKSSLVDLYKQGARHFLLFNVPPIDMVARPFDVIAMRSEIASLNSGLSKLRMKFQHAYPDASVQVFDVHELYTQVMRNPMAFPQTRNLKVTTETCVDYVLDNSPGDIYVPDCGVPLSQYFWHNLHVTETVHDVTAAYVAKDCYGPIETSPSGYCS